MRTADSFENWHRELPLGTGSIVRIGMMLILLGVGGAFLWGVLAPIAGAVIAPGVVAASGMNKSIQHLEGGIIEKILVREGDVVEDGQPLYKLSETAAATNLARLKSQWHALRLQEARYLAERDGKAEITWPQDILDQAADPAVAEMIQGQTNEFNARKAALDSQVAVLQKQMDAAEEQITGLEAQRKSVAQQAALMAEELKDTRGLFKKGLAPKTRLLALERSFAELDGRQGQFVSQIAQARQTIAEVQNRMLLARQSWVEKTVSDLRDVQVQVSDFGERLKAAEDVATRTEIRAPIAGQVVKLHFNTVGGVIQPGQVVAEILPNSALQVEARILPSDINRVFAGREANLRFPALRDRTTPVVPGTVAFVSPDRLVDPRTGESYYTVRVVLTDKLDADEARVAARLRPGMPAEVYVQTGERTFMQYLLSPVSDILAHSFREQ